ncbi:dynamin family protein [Colletotrichum incanum]|uniref:Dynamin family protein n=1 Tax=Colletotrichum incanum TaxID=1573173 RepID=A0A167E6N9_COLIC|nr:dynamin family protein [Colletotrichum incanum]
MVKRHIRDSWTIILAVLPSNVDVATQEILTFAEEADPAGDRTLGNLTKADLLRNEPPGLLLETRQKLANAEKKMKDLGAPRQTEHEQQQYLDDIASNFQILVRAALNADYSAHPAFNSNELRLITAVFNTTEQFSTDFYNFGRKSLFESETKIAPPVPGGVITLASPVFYDDEEEQEEKTEEDGDSSLQLDTFDISTPGAFLELERIIVMDWGIELPKKGIMKWIEAVHQRSLLEQWDLEIEEDAG